MPMLYCFSKSIFFSFFNAAKIEPKFVQMYTNTPVFSQRPEDDESEPKDKLFLERKQFQHKNWFFCILTWFLVTSRHFGFVILLHSVTNCINMCSVLTAQCVLLIFGIKFCVIEYVTMHMLHSQFQLHSIVSLFYENFSVFAINYIRKATSIFFKSYAKRIKLIIHVDHISEWIKKMFLFRWKVAFHFSYRRSQENERILKFFKLTKEKSFFLLTEKYFLK